MSIRPLPALVLCLLCACSGPSTPASPEADKATTAKADGARSGRADRAEGKASKGDKPEARGGKPEAKGGKAEAKGDRAGGKGGKGGKDKATSPGDLVRKHKNDVEAATFSSGQDILLITWGTIRADHSTAYAYHRDTTPWLAELVKGGAIRVNRFYTPMPSGVAAHASYLTCLMPDEIGVVSDRPKALSRLDKTEGVTTLPLHLRERGYLTAAFVSSSEVARGGFERGFTYWSEAPGERRPAEAVVQAFSRFLKDLPDDQPVFAWVHLDDAHAPYSPPGDWAGHFDLDTETVNLLRKGGFPNLKTPRGDQAIETVNAYDDSVRYVDAQSRAIAEAWDATGRSDRTALLVVGDHGESLDQHDTRYHHGVWDGQLRVPFVMQAPGLDGKAIEVVGSGNDLLPTLLGAVSLPGEEELVAQCTGSDLREVSGKRSVFASTPRQGNAPGAYALITDTHKLIVPERGQPMLFDLSRDPHELKDRAKESKDKLEALKKQAQATQKFQRERAAALGLRAGSEGE